MRAAEILAVLPDLPTEIRDAIYDLDARAYQSNAPVHLNESQTYIRLIGAIKSAGSEAAIARKAGIHRQSLADQLSGKRPLSPSVLRVIGLRRVETKAYVAIDP